MIKFFRKIRQKLLSENKLSRYLLYAIGEIILIILGIFFALQLQNWNEKQKQDTEFEIVIEQFYNAVKHDTETFDTHKKRIIDQINLIDDLLIQPDSFSMESLPNILGYLTIEDINSYTSETNHHLSNLKYNINNAKQNELSKQITSYVNSINEKFDFGQVERINPLFYELGIPEATWNFNEMGTNTNIENYYSQSDYNKLHALIRTTEFKAILKTLRSYKVIYQSKASNNYEDGLSIMNLIKNYYPNVKLLYQDVGIIGTAINGYDDVGATSTRMIQTDLKNSIWELDLYLKEGTVKFRCRDSWNQNWGGTSFPKGKAETNGENISVEEGDYHIVLNLSTNTYEFIKVAKE